MDCSTLVSVCPFPINETKPGLQPERFQLPAVKNFETDCVVLHVTNASFFVYIDMDRGSMKVNVPSEELAQSIVRDLITAQIAINLSDDAPATPGLFWVPGKISKEEIVKNHSVILKQARDAQRNWFNNLVKMADDDWSKYRQHKTISDTQRHALRALGLTRDWDIDIEKLSSAKSCPACMNKVPDGAAICPFCKCMLNEKAASVLKFA
jgi:hypothetical protein